MDMKIGDAAALLGASEKAIRMWIKKKALPAYKIRNQYLFNESEIREWALTNGFTLTTLRDEPGLTGKTVSVGTLLRRGGIHFNIEGSNIGDVMRNAVRCVKLPGSVDAERLSAELLKREAIITTAVGKGIAFPHPRKPIISDQEDERIAICHLKNPLDLKAKDNIPVRTLFIIVSSNGKRHLDILSGLASLCRTDEFIRLLREDTAGPVHAYLERREAGTGKNTLI